MRVVLDTNILIRANPKARGPARDLLEQIAFGNHVLVTSHFLLQEVERVLAYPRIQMRWRLRRHEVEAYLQILASMSEIVAPAAGSHVVPNDVDDDPIIYTATQRLQGEQRFYARAMPTFMKSPSGTSAVGETLRSRTTSSYCDGFEIRRPSIFARSLSRWFRPHDNCHALALTLRTFARRHGVA